MKYLFDNYLVFCQYIRNALRINYDGKLSPCCDFVGDSGFAVEEYQQYIASNWLDDLEKDLSNDVWPEGCKICKNYETRNLKSLRNQKTDGYKVDIVIGNTCNSDCGMCGPARSSKIASRLLKQPHPEHLLDAVDDQYLISNRKETAYEMASHGDFGEIFSKATEVKFVGGEPFLTKSIFRMIDQIYEIKPDMKIHMVTNASSVNDEQIMSLARFKELFVCLSAEAAGDQYEYIRHGLDWNVFSSNAKRLRDISRYAYLSVDVSALNIATVDSILDFGYANNIDAMIYQVIDPAILGLKNVATAVIESQLDSLDRLNPHNNRSLVQLKMFKKSLIDLTRDRKDKHDQRLIRYLDYLNSTRDRYKLSIDDLIVNQKYQ